jgi:hypothetical protein
MSALDRKKTQMLSSIKGRSNNSDNIFKHLGQERVNNMNYFSTINTEGKSIYILVIHTSYIHLYYIPWIHKLVR